MNNPEGYEKFKTASFATNYNNSIDFIVKNTNWQEGDVIMDYGCGSGKFAFKNLLPIAKGNSAKKIYGVDISAEMISFAATNFKSPLIEYSVGNMMDESNWAFEKESFNKFVSFLMLHFVKDYRSFFEKVCKLLKPGGQMALVVPFSRVCSVPYKLLSTDKWSKIYKNKDKHSRMAEWAYDIEEGITDFTDSLHETGFRVIKYESENAKVPFKNIEDLCEFLDILTTASKHVSEESKDEFMEDMKNLAGKLLGFPNVNGEVDSGGKYVNILAEKPVV